MDEAEILVIVDVQTDFCPGGALAVPGGNEIVPLVSNASSMAAAEESFRRYGIERVGSAEIVR